MKLLTAHRILIGTSIAFFLFFAALQVRNFLADGQLGGVLAALVAVLVSGGLALYLRRLRGQ